MSVTSEQLMAALFSLTEPLQDNPFPTRSRIVKQEAGIAGTSQPSLYQVWIGVETTQLTGTPKVNKYTMWWVLYADRGEDINALASDVMAPLVDACDKALAPPPGLDSQTLGGLVTWARREGRVEISEAPLGQQVIAVYPVSVLVPDGLTC